MGNTNDIGTILLSTFPCEDIATEVVKKLLEKKLCACANMLKVNSLYTWKGKIEVNKEFLCIFKTTTYNLPKLAKEIIRLHPYETPEIVELEMKSVNSDYLRWMEKVTLSSS
ncbi:MAG TPA: divalent-cation tolerance protein CutA [Nitrososphaeraceae archaeon]|jgi:periplasmic divalent cation tolerance protein